MVQHRTTIARSAYLNLLGFLVPLIVQLITVPFYLRIIGPERYGVMALVWLVLGYFGFFDLGFGQAIASRLANLRDASAFRRQTVFWTGTFLSVAAGVVGGLVILGVSQPLFTRFLSVPGDLHGEIRAALPLLALALPVITATSALSGTLQGCEAFGALNFGQTIGAVLYQILPLCVAVSVSDTLFGLIAGAIAGRMVSVVLLLLSCMRRFDCSLSPKITMSEAKGLFGFGSWVTLGGILGPLFMLLDRIAIGSALGMQAVTIYTIPYNFILRIGVLPSSLQNALFPRFANMPKAEALTLLRSSVLLVGCIMTPVLMIVVFGIKPFLLLWIGRDLGTAAGLVGQIVAIGFWFNAMSFVPFSFIQSRGRPDVPAKCHMLEMVAYLPLLVFATSHFGVAGTSVVWSLRVCANMILMFMAAGIARQLLVVGPALAPLGLSFWWTTTTPSSTLLDLLGCAVIMGIGLVWVVQNVPAQAYEFVPRRASRFISATKERIFFGSGA